MIFEVILFIVGLVIGRFLIGNLFKSHKHNYEIKFHRKLTDTGITSYRYGVSEEERKDPNFQINPDSIWVSYKKCSICGHVLINVSNGSQRKFFMDHDMLKDKIELILFNEQEQKDRELMDSVNDRISSHILTRQQSAYIPPIKETP